MSNSPLTNEIFLVPSTLYGSRKGQKISKITIHHMAGHLTGKQCYSAWTNRYNTKKQAASANYSICDGVIALHVEEKDRAYTSSSSQDQQAITIEVANVKGANYSNDPKLDWVCSDLDVNTLVALCADICHRNGFRLHWTGDSTGSLTIHQLFASTHCPGNFLKQKITSGEIENRVNAAADKMDEEEEWNNMNEEKFNEFMQSWLSKQASQDPSRWALGELAEAVANGITDGTRPRSFCTRQEAAIMINNALKGEKKDDS